MKLNSRFKLGEFARIDVFLHWTLVVTVVGLFVWLLYRGGLSMAIDAIILVAALFVCVILHEFGHALTARRYGIPTLNITMYPIGGIALLAHMPRVPRQELMIAIAGPAVNFIIAWVLWILATIGGYFTGPDNLIRPDGEGLALISTLAWMNFILVIFNMIPAFPMDGGRVLRSALAMRMSFRTATRIAGYVGQILAVIFALIAIFPNPIYPDFSPLLLFIAFFVFTAARQETAQVLENS